MKRRMLPMRNTCAPAVMALMLAATLSILMITADTADAQRRKGRAVGPPPVTVVDVQIVPINERVPARFPAVTDLRPKRGASGPQRFQEQRQGHDDEDGHIEIHQLALKKAPRRRLGSSPGRLGQIHDPHGVTLTLRCRVAI